MNHDDPPAQSMSEPLNEAQVISTTRRWIGRFVVGMNLCPFARAELDADRVRYAVSVTDDPLALLQALEQELYQLQSDASIETTLLIHPAVLQDFADYNGFLADAEELVEIMGLEGVVQIASFHPDYRFAGTTGEAAENYSNRSPYPMLHLLREASVEQAIDVHPDPEGIPERNIARLNATGATVLKALWESSFTDC
ncbi:conserved hypothetical protein [Luminiphilus syltensis NOR5-1B]|uniref:Uncharacterized protein n=1 Tax=Luminiphilus syltensis NOR5-1B TaxID=565045 RepID=B8KVA6_9GAMM|nr:DUF1415 domain-containing protein [Luminiphilus syltensis]EED36667.1 conserved hypothetical protein [Luminiphilus syltensis NOR5-1B]